MSLVRALGLGLGLVLVTGLSAQDEKPKKGDKEGKIDEMLVGEWKITGGMKAGEKAGDDAKKGKVTVTKDKITLADGEMKFVFSYKLDATKDPVEIDMEIVEPDALKGAKAKGIIKGDKGKGTLCYHPMMGERPKKFESTKDNGAYLFELEKVEKGAKPVTDK
jgi:uncharacterized protein (TIGR03067 family)